MPSGSPFSLSQETIMSGAFFSFPFTNVGTIVAATAAADGALGVGERTKTALDAITNGVTYEIPRGINSLEVRFLGTTNGDNHTIDVWMGKRSSLGKTVDLCRVATLDVETGTQVATDTPSSALLFADEITLSNEAWYKDIRVIQSGNDTELLSRLYISDTCGYDIIAFHGHTTFANNLQIEVSGFTSFFDLIPT